MSKNVIPRDNTTYNIGVVDLGGSFSDPISVLESFFQKVKIFFSE
jgi:hypothetical protein